MRGALWVALLVVPAVASAAQVKIAVLPAQIDETSKGAVPKIFDDYLLAAVQNVSGGEVIGQEDINALLSFDKQKQLFGCDDVSCMADIGGALGVDKTVVVKITRLQNDWVITAKLINLREVKVEARTNDFVGGDAKALLQAVPAVVKKLFGGGGPQSATSASGSGVAKTTTATATSGPPQHNAMIGRTPRIVGIAMTVGGDFFATIGVALNLLGVAAHDAGSEWAGMDVVLLIYGGMLSIPGFILSGIGASIYLNGKAALQAQQDGAKGYSSLAWLGWVLAVVALVGPWVTLAVDLRPGVAYATGIVGLVGSCVTFGMGMASSSSYLVDGKGAQQPLASLTVIRVRDRAVPGVALAMRF
ncbi:MAG: hypothetical protein HY903_07485 [Deltaproteobacteria bacterium]|nr:hypothetical protein [Deltaproteobacteria bacterium]